MPGPAASSDQARSSDRVASPASGREARLGPVTSLAARARAADTASTSGRRSVVLVDGRSGTGKTTLGGALAIELGAQLVHLDDVYPGWDGLLAASTAVVEDVLGTPSGYRQWDWERSEPAAWVSLDPDEPLVVEGCGALSRASASLATLRIWMSADDAERKRRAIDRDGAVFAEQWDRWAAQEDAFIAEQDPASLADVVLRS
ncbi:ATP-binding protein [Curtobacterium sp. VKM Ac-2865]|uniref:ATP-binding protein n=1 Tax=Curtobacterium sp. VKM Ac-2865 TaxID=2783817 RepID=UPI00188A3DCF|nr:ATP-binding protein [Curtobacterium sp. VKM Ac-2865]MBF4583609.1 ATP-binding protein [Curtobacterium sp. VKM Ac-2865]